MELGAFSVSLAVKDLAASRAFYETLGFEPFMGDPEQGWLVLRNGDHVIGLFQGGPGRQSDPRRPARVRSRFLGRGLQTWSARW